MNTQLSATSTIKVEVSTIGFGGIIYRFSVTGEINAAIGGIEEVNLHICTFKLVVKGVGWAGDLLYGEGCGTYMGVTEGGIAKEEVNGVAAELELFLPEVRATVHMESRICTCKRERVGCSLNVATVKTDAMIGESDTRGIHTESKDGIGMEVKGIAIAIFEETGATTDEGTLCTVIVITIIPCQGDKSTTVAYLHTAKAFSEGIRTVEINRIGNKCPAAADYEGTIKKVSAIKFGMILSPLGIYRSRIGEDT
jgi:hypothetical protein